MDFDFTGLGLKVLEILSPVLLAALTWAAAKAAQLIAAKVKNEYLRGALTRLDDAVLNAVREVHQVTVEGIKAASADGKLTVEERAKVKATALETIRAHMGPAGLAELVKVLGVDNGGLEKLLSTRIEAAVHDLKRARTNGYGGAGQPLPFAA